MIKLFNIPEYKINTGKLGNLLHGDIVHNFEENFCNYLGGYGFYGLALNSATTAIFLSMLNKNTMVDIPSILPHVVANAIITSGNGVRFKDDISWVGHSYILYRDKDYSIIDSAQEVDNTRFFGVDNLYIYSFYPTKPVGSCDGGMIVSRDKKKIDELRILAYNGTDNSVNSWGKSIERIGYKCYMNSIQAYIANENLKKLDEKLYILSKIRDQYNDAFNLKNSSSHLYRVNVKGGKILLNIVISDLARQEGITCGIHYKALHGMKVFKNCGLAEAMIQSGSESNTTLSIPFHEKLTQKEINKVIKFTKKYI
ncbi:MAG: DegT/DnrJ/EryC1/StrS family aminotransferase [Candidatus Nanoarchaeia archaeon]|nr:DegT/DnrJ/EryC1/StrS family aminotransferase [Candidatus Nanoarchaeia archaeon]